MESELYWSQLREGTIATAQPNCNGKTLGNMLVPIPPLHEQIRNILTTLNYSEDVEHGIEIVFPVALDSESVQFTIIDTPGSDSNYQEHQNVLMDALSEQKQSILI